jgi:RHS repeat-associated protein
VTGTGSGQSVSYTVLAMNALGQVTQAQSGNGVTTVNAYDSQTARLQAIQATLSGQSSGNVLNHAYAWDAIGNLTTRADNTPGVGTQESFSYDSVNRLTLATILGGAVSPPQVTEVMYDARDNITYKSDVGRYWYDPQRPNRMTQVTLETAAGAQIALTGTRALSYAFDNTRTGAQTVNGVTVGNGNLEYTVSQDTVNNRHTVRSETYTSFNMPSQIVYGNFVTTTSSTSDRTLSFVYGPEHQRVKQTVQLSGSGTSSYKAGTTWYMNGIDSLGLSYEKEVQDNGTTEHKHYVGVGADTFAIFVSRTGNLNGNPATTTSYLHKDHLGSVAAITNEAGTTVERLAYDPWGKRRQTNGIKDSADSIVGQKTERGYTMHEHLDEVGVIHMNARIYDPLIGRFMSPDDVIPNPTDLKAFNRYSYVANNPLRLVDPTGHLEEEPGRRSGDSGAGEVRVPRIDTMAFGGVSFYFADDGAMERAAAFGGASNTAPATDKTLTSTSVNLGQATEDSKDDSQGTASKTTSPSPACSGEHGDCVVVSSKRDATSESQATQQTLGDQVKEMLNELQRTGCVQIGSTCTGFEAGVGGTVKAVAPQFLKYADPKFAQQLATQLSRDGSKSIFRSMASLETRIEEHISKLDSLQFKSSVEREIRTFQKQLETIQQFIVDNGLKLP